MNMTEEMPYCKFLKGPCTQAQCVAYQARRPIAQEERWRYNAADIPSPNYVEDWCIKYNKTVTSVIVVTEQEV